MTRPYSDNSLVSITFGKALAPVHKSDKVSEYIEKVTVVNPFPISIRDLTPPISAVQIYYSNSLENPSLSEGILN